MPTFPNAPIREAVLDIFVDLPATTTIQRLEDFKQDLPADYSTIKKRRHFTGKIEFDSQDGEKSKANVNQEILGFLHESPSNQKAVQARLNGFSFNKLRPYTKWTKFSEEAKSLWEKYRTIAEPTAITQIGLRYINSIEIPIPFRDFRDYCLLFPIIPDSMPQELDKLFMEFAAPIKDSTESHIHTKISVTFEPAINEGKTLPLLLDIGVQQRLPNLHSSDNSIWQSFENLRNIKNQLFASSLTPEALKLFV